MKNGNCNDLNIDILEDKYTKPKESHWFLRRVYILTWIGLYDREKAVADLIAGITLGLTIIPQSIAYASLAGLSSEYGLYSAFIGAYAWISNHITKPSYNIAYIIFRFYYLCILWHYTSSIDWSHQFNGSIDITILLR